MPRPLVQPPSATPIANFNDLCGESPIWHPDLNTLYWTDINGRKFFSYAWNERSASVVQEGFEVCGFALNAGGGFVVVNNSGFWLWDVGSAPIPLANQADGVRLAMNDCIAEPGGGIIAGTCFYDPSRADSPRGHLVHLSPRGPVRVLDEGFELANGLGFSVDERTLYFADSAARIIYAYDYDVGAGSVRNRRVFVRVSSQEGMPDGLTVDSEGFVWSAQWFGSCIVRYDPDGKVERRLHIPATQTSSLTFGGPYLTDIFVTSASYPDALPLAPKGYNAHDNYSGGKLFHFQNEIAGKPEYRCRISKEAIGK